jgi:hypothetical protein
MVNLLIFTLIVIGIQVFRLFWAFQKNQKLKHAVHKRQQEIAYLASLTSHAVNEDESIQEFFPKHLNLMKETVNWNYLSVFRLDEQKQVLIIRFTGYLPNWYMEELGNKVLVKVGDASVGRAVSLKQPVTINTATVDPRFSNVKIYAGETGYRSLTCCPVMGMFKTYGGFCAYSAYVNIFTAHDSQFLFTCANYYGGILEYKLLERFYERKD